MTISSLELKAFLVATPFFGGLSDASLDLLISMLVERRFDVGATVVAEGEPGCSMYIVHSGELVVSKLGESECVVRIAALGPGDFFGEMTLIEMQNRSATVVADSPTVLYELTARNLYTYYKADIYAYVMVMQNINRELCRRLRRADNRIAELQMLQASQWHRCACVTWLRKGNRKRNVGAMIWFCAARSRSRPLSQLGQSGHFGRRPALLIYPRLEGANSARTHGAAWLGCIAHWRIAATLPSVHNPAADVQ
jgi:CRP-like cAMP-binding protein